MVLLFLCNAVVCNVRIGNVVLEKELSSVQPRMVQGQSQLPTRWFMSSSTAMKRRACDRTMREPSNLVITEPSFLNEGGRWKADLDL
ncbi:hypothetical protein MRB53_024399 [Persea americana]|uniref:Uncharacterized protein n=1 Tax=Persea americana TaxID=3435 RepID=A0ACC2LC58_PERAE|nr:hypothetical protein MRB53_024399 [Persea americana]